MATTRTTNGISATVPQLGDLANIETAFNTYHDTISDDISSKANSASPTLTGTVSIGTSSTASFIDLTYGTVSTNLGLSSGKAFAIGGTPVLSSTQVLGLTPTTSNANTAASIVARDSSGNFTATTITANLVGNVTGSVTGSVTGDVYAPGGTIILDNGSSGGTTAVFTGNITASAITNGRITTSNSGSSGTSGWSPVGKIFVQSTQPSGAIAADGDLWFW